MAAMSRTSTVHGVVPADALERPLLEHAQQLHLRRGGDLADLVEEERAAVRLLEPPDPPLVGAGERAALVAEQLALEQGLRERRAVQRHERRLRARALRVDRARELALARAALAGDEHRRPRARDLPGHPVDLLHRRARPDQPLHALALGALAAAGGGSRPRPGARAAPGALQREEERVEVDRLRQVILGPRPHRQHRRGHVPERGDDDHRQRRILLAQLPEQRHPIHPRHLQIGDHRRPAAAPPRPRPPRRRPPPRRRYSPPGAELLQPRARARLVVHDEHPRALLLLSVRIVPSEDTVSARRRDPRSAAARPLPRPEDAGGRGRAAGGRRAPRHCTRARAAAVARGRGSAFAGSGAPPRSGRGRGRGARLRGAGQRRVDAGAELGAQGHVVDRLGGHHRRGLRALARAAPRAQGTR